MKSRLIWMCVALVAVVAVACWQRLVDDTRPARVAAEPTDPSLGARARQGERTAATVRPLAPASGAPTSQPVSAVTPTANAAIERQGDDSTLPLDTSGRLIKNAQTRDEIEKMLNGSAAELQDTKQEILATLPPAAAQEALDLLERFANYRAGMRQALPETALAMNEQEALVMLGTVHALRVTYFGPELAQAFFGAEEAIGQGTAEGLLKAGSDAR